MNRWRKKPVEAEAAQLTEDNLITVADWVSDSGTHCDQYTDRLIIRTPEGDMTGVPGDWIIRGVHGEFYPCKPDIFAATYEPADGGDRRE